MENEGKGLARPREWTVRALRRRERENIAVWIGYTGIQVPLTVKSSGEEWRRSVGPLSLSRVSRYLRLRLSYVCTTSPVVTFSLPPSDYPRRFVSRAASVERTFFRIIVENNRWFDIRGPETFRDKRFPTILRDTLYSCVDKATVVYRPKLTGSQTFKITLLN